MIKIKYSACLTDGMVKAFQILGNAKVNSKIAYAIKKLADSLEQSNAKINDEFQIEVVSKFAVKNEAGALEIPESAKEEFLKAKEAFGEKIAVIERPKLSLPELDGIIMTASDMKALEPLMEDEALKEVSEPAQLSLV